MAKLQWAVALWAAFLVLNNYSIVTTRTPGPSWKHNLGEARLKCMGRLPEPTTASVNGPAHPVPGDKIDIYVAPNVTPPLWAVQATCRQIQR